MSHHLCYYSVYGRYTQYFVRCPVWRMLCNLALTGSAIQYYLKAKGAWVFPAKDIVLAAFFIVSEWSIFLREISRSAEWRKACCLWGVIQKIKGRHWVESSLKAVKQGTSLRTWVNVPGRQHAAFKLYLPTGKSGLRTELFSVQTIFMFITEKGVLRQRAYLDRSVFCAC